VLYYGVLFLVVAVIAGVFGFAIGPVGTGAFAKVLFIVFIGLAGVSLLAGLFAGSDRRSHG
jgi:uncharacterized membrane protein YtjA (UPF0391 family)